MRRMRISTLLADPNHSSFRQHHVTTTCRRYARRRHQTTSTIPAPGYTGLSHPSLRFARFCRHTHTGLQPVFPQKERYELAEKLMRAPSWELSDRRTSLCPFQPQARLSAKVREANSGKGRLRNEANNRLNGLEWGGGSTGDAWLRQTRTEMGKRTL